MEVCHVRPFKKTTETEKAKIAFPLSVVIKLA